MRVLVAMSGGVDSSVAAALLVEEGHEVVGVTMKLWDGPSDSGCCSLADVHDAQRVADKLGIVHHVFNYRDEFRAHVVDPYVAAHAAGETPNPCAACNRYVKFAALLERAERLGFDAIATGHYARVEDRGAGRRLYRGVDGAKDQSYVLSMLTTRELDRVLLPIGTLEKDAVRAFAAERGLVTAAKPDSQDVCFIPAAADGRRQFLGERIELHAGDVVDETGRHLGRVEAVELVTIGQRRGLPAAGRERHFVRAVDIDRRVVEVGPAPSLLVEALDLDASTWTWCAPPLRAGDACLVQVSAHGGTRPGHLRVEGVVYDQPERRVAPGQLVALYRGDEVVGSAVAS